MAISVAPWAPIESPTGERTSGGTSSCSTKRAVRLADPSTPKR